MVSKFMAAVMVLAPCGTSLWAALYVPTGSSASAKFNAQSSATSGNLMIGLIDSTGQEAVLFDNTSPPGNPDGIGPVGAGAIADLTFAPQLLTVDVTNEDPTGFMLGYGNSSYDYTDFILPFSFFVQDGSNTYLLDSAANADHLAHLLVTPSGDNYVLSYSGAGNGVFDDANVTLSGISAIPEPATLALLPLGLLALLTRRRGPRPARA